MTRCAKCGKNFDEEMYCHICPKCGFYNKQKEKYDVNQYYTSFDDDSMNKRFNMDDWQNASGGVKVSTQKEAQRAHEELHRRYEHTSATKAHEKHTMIFDREQPPQVKRKKPKLLSVCVILEILAIIITVIYCKFAYMQATQTAHTLSFESFSAQPGESFDVEGRSVCVNRVKQIDTSILTGVPEGEKLVAVFLDVANQDMGYQADSESGYIFDGKSYKEPLSAYKLDAILPSIGLDSDGLLAAYGYLHRDTEDGYFLFLVEEEASRLEFIVEEQTMKNHVLVVTKQITVPMELEE